MRPASRGTCAPYVRREVIVNNAHASIEHRVATRSDQRHVPITFLTGRPTNCTRPGGALCVSCVAHEFDVGFVECRMRPASVLMNETQQVNVRTTGF